MGIAGRNLGLDSRAHRACPNYFRGEKRSNKQLLGRELVSGYLSSDAISSVSKLT
jgi:hypothetical protein